MARYGIDDLKIIIKSIVISSKEPITIQQLTRDFKESEGVHIPFASLGYSNILDFLHSLKDTLQVLPDKTLKAVQSSETKHLEILIQKQRPSKKKRSRNQSLRLQGRSVNYTQTQYNRQRSLHPRNQTGALTRARYSGSRANYCTEKQRVPDYSVDGRRSLPPHQYSNTTNHYAQQKSLYHDQYAFSSSSNSSCDSFEVVTCEKINEVENQLHHKSAQPSVDLPELRVSVTKVDYSSALTTQLKNNLRDIIREHPDGIMCSQLSHLVREKYGVLLNYKKYGFTNMIELVGSIPQIFKIQDRQSHDWLLLDAQKVSSDSPVKNKVLPVARKVCERVQEVAETISCPFSTLQFNKRYENMFQKSLLEEVEGFSSVQSILMSIDKDFVRLKEINGEYYVVPFNKTKLCALDACPIEGGDEFEYPKHMLPLGGEVPPLEPFSDEAITPVMEVKLGEIYNPHKFYIMSTYLKNAYNNLHRHIQLFYAESAHLALTNLPVKKGLFCVAPYLDKWHRAVIAHVCNQTQVMVFLIDFGTHLKLPKSDLRFLHKDFASIPRLALRASLEDIVPLKNSEKFSKEANILFFKLTAEKLLRARIKTVDFTQRKYLVELKEVDGNSEVFITTKLVDAGVAEFRQNSHGNSASSASTPECRSNVPISSSVLLPSFQALSVQESPGEKTESKPCTAQQESQSRKTTGAILLSLLRGSRKLVL